MSGLDVAILGAGPYGLSAAAHLRNIPGLDFRIFGEPMDFWKAHMPEGMFLRSPWEASNLSDPKNELNLNAFCAASRISISKPIPLDRFVDYGLWFQSQVAPNLDRRFITRINRDSGGFRLLLSNGEEVGCKKVIVGAGINSFARRLPQFEGIPAQFVSHASDGRDVQKFSGKKVVVIGAGQSALESAALLHEAGAEVEVIVRESSVHWLGWRARMQKLGPIAKLLYSPHDIGPAGISRIVAMPDVLRYFPRGVQNRFRVRALRPAGARWLTDRFHDIPITKQRQVSSAALRGDRLQLRLDDGSERDVDHVLLGTGYKVEIFRYPFLPAELSKDLAQANGFVLVNAGFESSVPGLHFLGAPSAWSFGPLMYFVCGTDFAAHKLARYLSSRASSNGAK
jgi:FAD-dependent urate hydroxylase